MMKNKYRETEINLSNINAMIKAGMNIYSRNHGSPFNYRKLSEHIGVIPSTLANHVCGRSCWTISELQKISRVLNINSNLLIFGQIQNQGDLPRLTKSKIFSKKMPNGKKIFYVKEVSDNELSSTNHSNDIRSNEISSIKKSMMDMMKKLEKLESDQDEAN